MTNAVDIMKEFHRLDDKGRAAVIGEVTSEAPPAKLSALGKAIIELPDQERAGVLAAIKQDFDASGKLKETAGLSPDERVAERLPGHAFRAGASVPEGIALDATGKAHEIKTPPADATEKQVEKDPQQTPPVNTNQVPDNAPVKPAAQTAGKAANPFPDRMSGSRRIKAAQPPKAK